MTLDRTRSELDQPVRSADELVAYFVAGEKPRPAWRLGLEHEKIALSTVTQAPVPYDGAQGVAAVLEGMATEGGGERLYEADRLVALDDDGASVTIEPGGQLELSGAPVQSVFDAVDELKRHTELARRVGDRLGIAWLSLGVQPLHDAGALPRMPKERYRIMRSYRPPRGSMALDMMHATASVQASFDYASEADMAAKMRTALGLQAIVGAIFANSSLSGGKPSGFISKRMAIWRHTDPARCGGIPFVFEPDFGYRRYLEWALDIPLFFVVRQGRYLAEPGLTFRQFMERGHEGEQATLADFDRHLTTLFPDVRLKRLIEVRGADSVPLELVSAVPALWKGLLYDEAACAAGFSLVANQEPEQREAVYEAIARHGLAARVAGSNVLELAREVVAIADAGLRRLGDRDAGGRDAATLLDPVRELLERGQSPGEIVLERWEGDWQRSAERLIRDTRY